MSTVTIEHAQAHLGDLIDQLHPGEEIVITRDESPIARIVGEIKLAPTARTLGTLKGTVLYMAPDFESPLDDFQDDV